MNKFIFSMMFMVTSLLSFVTHAQFDKFDKSVYDNDLQGLPPGAQFRVTRTFFASKAEQTLFAQKVKDGVKCELYVYGDKDGDRSGFLTAGQIYRLKATRNYVESDTIEFDLESDSSNLNLTCKGKKLWYHESFILTVAHFNKLAKQFLEINLDYTQENGPVFKEL